MNHKKLPLEVFYKRVFLEILRVPQVCNFIKKGTPAQVLSCEFYEIPENIFFYRTPLVAASEPCYS